MYIFCFYVLQNISVTGSAAVMDTDSDRFSPLKLTDFKAVPGLLSASALRDALRTPDSPR